MRTFHFRRAATALVLAGVLLAPRLHAAADHPDAVAHAKRAMALHGEKKYGESLDAAGEALKLGFKNHDFFLVIGDSLMRLQNYKQAHGAFGAALELELDSRVALRGRLTAALNAGFPDSAVDSAQRLIDLGENEYLRRGRALASSGRMIDAISDFQYVLRHAKADDPQRIDGYFQRARALEKLGAFDLAIADFDRALEIRELPAIHQLRGETLSKMSKSAEAIDAFARVIELAENEDVLLYRGREYGRAKMYEKAVADFKRAAEIAPDDAETQGNSKTNIARMEKLKAEGEPAVKAAAKPDPDRAKMEALDFNNSQAALEQINAVLTENPESISALRALANHHRLAGRGEEAFEAIGKAAKIDRDNPAVIEEFAITAVMIGQRNYAIQGFSRAIAKGSTEAFVGRASLFVTQGIAGVALSDLEKALANDAENPALHFVHGISLLEQEDADPKHAAAAFAKAMKLGYDGERIYRAQTYQKLNRFEEAAADLTHDIERTPQSPSLLLHRALCYRRLQKLDAALGDFQSAARHSASGSPQNKIALEGIEAIESLRQNSKE